MLWSGFSTAPSTVWCNIQEFPRGTHAVLDEARVAPAPVRYWATGGAARGRGMAAQEMLEESVRLHLVSDVLKVVFLSGGLDSSAVVALARRHERQLTTMSLGFAERAADETRYAEAVAHAAGTRHISIVQTPAELLDGIDGAIGALDQPSFDAINTWLVFRAERRVAQPADDRADPRRVDALVFRAAAGPGFKVGLSGAGGDELTGGYSSFRRLPRLARMLQGLGGRLAPRLRGCSRASRRRPSRAASSRIWRAAAATSASCTRRNTACAAAPRRCR